MVSAISVAARFEDLLDHPPRESSYDFGRIFRADTWRARRLSRKKFKLLRKIDPHIRAMLGEGEKVYYVTWGVESSILESFFLGWVMYYVNRRAFVFTTRRVLLIQIGGRQKALQLRSQVQYTAIERVKGTGLGNLKVSFRDGSSVLFISMPRADRKFLVELVRSLAGQVEADPAGARGSENLCPHCYVEVDGFPRLCASCGKGFKSARAAGLLSLLFPGFGDVYLGHRALGTMEVLGGTAMWLSLFAPVEGQEPLALAEWIFAAGILFLFMHGIDALFTRHMGRKGIYPAKG